MTGIVAEPSRWRGWQQLAVDLVEEMPTADQAPDERRRSLRTLIAECKAEGAAVRRSRSHS